MSKTGTVRVSITSCTGQVYAIHEISGDALEWLAYYGSPSTAEEDTPEVITEILHEITYAAGKVVA